MRNYVVQGVEYKKKSIDSLTTRLESNRAYQHLSWVDFFFMHDVHIIGLGLDFVEIHLWWLLTYRARANISGKSCTQNRVIYYCPRERQNEDGIKLRFLKANKVEIKYFDCPNHDKRHYYGSVLRSLINQKL